MANHSSALKKERRDEKKRKVNRINLTKMRNKIKLLRKRVDSGEKDSVEKLFRDVVSTIDKTRTKGAIHKNTAARYKARINTLVQKAGIKI